MASTGTDLPAPPNDHDDDFPHTENVREEMHAYVKTGQRLWFVWAIGAFVLVTFVYLWWTYNAAKRISVPIPDDTQAPPPLQ
jgi:hypothetical protein